MLHHRLPAPASLATATLLACFAQLRAEDLISPTLDLAAPDGSFRLFAKPYAARADSFVSGPLQLVAHPDQARFPNRFHVPASAGLLSWAKTALPDTPKTPDKSYRAGFASSTVALLDPWLPLSAKSTLVNGANIPAGTLAQRLSLVNDGAASAELSISYGLDPVLFGERASFLPTDLALSPAGAFSGSFVLSDQVSPPPNPSSAPSPSAAPSAKARTAPPSPSPSATSSFPASPRPTNTSPANCSSRPRRPSELLTFTDTRRGTC